MAAGVGAGRWLKVQLVVHAGIGGGKGGEGVAGLG